MRGGVTKQGLPSLAVPILRFIPVILTMGKWPGFPCGNICDPRRINVARMDHCACLSEQKKVGCCTKLWRQTITKHSPGMYRRMYRQRMLVNSLKPKNIRQADTHPRQICFFSTSASVNKTFIIFITWTEKFPLFSFFQLALNELTCNLYSYPQ